MWPILCVDDVSDEWDARERTTPPFFLMRIFVKWQSRTWNHSTVVSTWNSSDTVDRPCLIKRQWQGKSSYWVSRCFEPSQPQRNISGRKKAVRAPDSWSKGSEFESRQERRDNFPLQVNSVCWLLFSVRSTSVLPQWHVKGPGHSANSAGGRLHLNTHKRLTQQSRIGLTMPVQA